VTPRLLPGSLGPAVILRPNRRTVREFHGKILVEFQTIGIVDILPRFARLVSTGVVLGADVEVSAGVLETFWWRKTVWNRDKWSTFYLNRMTFSAPTLYVDPFHI
jgi:hypothetical protein